MKIIICVKAVPARLVDSSSISEKFVLNPYDIKCVETACNLKRSSEDEIICISMGKADAESVLRQCISMGADSTYLLEDSRFAGSDTLATTYVLSEAIKKIGNYDLILCGKQAVDGDTGQVGIGLAERLGIKCVLNTDTDIRIISDKLMCDNLSDNKLKKILVKLPVLLTINQFSNVVQAASMRSIKKARNAEIIKWNGEDLQLDMKKCGILGSRTTVVKSYSVKNKNNDLVEIMGSREEKTNKLYDILMREIKFSSVGK